ncbi:hypothetical protein Emed_000349 [Eimeria media]
MAPALFRGASAPLLQRSSLLRSVLPMACMRGAPLTGKGAPKPALSSGLAAASMSARGFASTGPSGQAQVYHEGLLHTEFSSKLDISKESPVIPIFRILSPDGVVDENWKNPFDKDETIELYKFMIRLSIWDNMLYNVQRQEIEIRSAAAVAAAAAAGVPVAVWRHLVCKRFCCRFSFYIQNQGEEATQCGIGRALQPEDHIFCQYRELGVLLMKGFTIEDALGQLLSNKGDEGKGRQMPISYSKHSIGLHTICTPLTTQVKPAAAAVAAAAGVGAAGVAAAAGVAGAVAAAPVADVRGGSCGAAFAGMVPHSMGAGYAFRLGKEQRISVGFFGEGAASEGDFHAAANFAATLKGNTLLVCRNNGYAISTPVKDQYAGDGIAIRGIAYGMRTIRVDGNDLFASYLATKTARDLILQTNEPVLMEFMTYRVGQHSTSDDSSAYRPPGEMEAWSASGILPIARMRKYLAHQGWWTDAEDEDLRKDARSVMLGKMKEAEKQSQQQQPQQQQQQQQQQQVNHTRSSCLVAASAPPAAAAAAKTTIATAAAQAVAAGILSLERTLSPLPQAATQPEEEKRSSSSSSSSSSSATSSSNSSR